MKCVASVAMVVAGMMVVGLLAGQLLAVAAEGGDNAAPAGVAVEKGTAASTQAVDAPKADEAKKGDAVKPTNARVAMITAAMAAIEEAQKAVDEGNKEAATAALAKAKAQLTALNKSMEPRAKKSEEKPAEGEKKAEGDKKVEGEKKVEMKVQSNVMPPDNAK